MRSIYVLALLVATCANVEAANSKKKRGCATASSLDGGYNDITDRYNIDTGLNLDLQQSFVMRSLKDGSKCLKDSSKCLKDSSGVKLFEIVFFQDETDPGRVTFEYLCGVAAQQSSKRKVAYECGAVKNIEPSTGGVNVKQTAKLEVVFNVDRDCHVVSDGGISYRRTANILFDAETVVDPGNPYGNVGTLVGSGTKVR